MLLKFPIDFRVQYEIYVTTVSCIRECSTYGATVRSILEYSKQYTGLRYTVYGSSVCTRQDYSTHYTGQPAVCNIRDISVHYTGLQYAECGPTLCMQYTGLQYAVCGTTVRSIQDYSTQYTGS